MVANERWSLTRGVRKGRFDGSHKVCKNTSLIVGTVVKRRKLEDPLKGKYHGVFFFTSFVKNVELRPSLCYKMILEQREERNQLNS